jgi:mycothiol system anti-sigma-R factor
VSCEKTRTIVHGYLDGELDAVRAAEFERHLEDCPECIAELESQEALRSSMLRAELYEMAPEALRTKVLRDTTSAASLEMPKRPQASDERAGRTLPIWLGVAAAVLLAVAVGWFALRSSAGNNSEQMVAVQVVDAHLRALQPGHLTDVVSSNQHTVKPWFDGKLDFAPPVRDLAESGFPLQGGRLDVVNGRSVAVLVYGRRQHVINVFVWPSAGADTQPTTGTRLGYNWVEWRNGGMEIWAVSDLNANELSDLQRLLM